MSLIKNLITVFFLIVILLGISSVFLPSDWQVERSIVIKATPEKIYPLVSNFKTGWVQWSAFDTGDPDIKYNYSGPEAGEGAQRSWLSEKMGDGEQRITKADVNSGVEFSLVMTKNNYRMNGRISFLPQADGTLVIWRDWGASGYNPIYRWLSFFMDEMMGPMFEVSLKALKTKAEL